MANTTVSASNKMTRFENSVISEYVRGGRFGPYIGPSINNIIFVKKQKNGQLSIPLVGKLSGPGVSGNGTLAGNEEPLANYGMLLNPTHHRNGVLISDEDRQKSAFDLYEEARPNLMNWAMEKKMYQVLQAFGAVQANGIYYNYGGFDGATDSQPATAAAMDTWNAANSDRILYGAAKSNLVSGNHTSSLTNIDTTNDKLNADMVSLAKRMANTASPLLRPYQLKSDEPWYVMFVGSLAFRDLKANLRTLQADALPRNINDNPIWSGGDLVYDGVIIKEIPEIDKLIDGTGTSQWDGIWGAGAASGDSLATGGASGSRVGVGFLVGAQAVAMGIGEMPSFETRKEDDYGFQHGVAVVMKHDIKKTFFNNKQHSVVTVFHSAASDA